mmetsp:Transcript_41288/g.44832  ORF Transcript_41288/g.44832 Transcript_41288/m.44832 type:complete len:123 (+) Transcript_41288:95-463(+)
MYICISFVIDSYLYFASFIFSCTNEVVLIFVRTYFCYHSHLYKNKATTKPITATAVVVVIEEGSEADDSIELLRLTLGVARFNVKSNGVCNNSSSSASEPEETSCKLRSTIVPSIFFNVTSP